MTPSEERAARLAAQGLSNKEIAAQIRSTENGVKQFLHRAFREVGVTCREELTQRMQAQEK